VEGEVGEVGRAEARGVRVVVDEAERDAGLVAVLGWDGRQGVLGEEGDLAEGRVGPGVEGELVAGCREAVDGVVRVRVVGAGADKDAQERGRDLCDEGGASAGRGAREEEEEEEKGTRL